MSLAGAEKGLGETGIGEWAAPNIVLVGTGSGVVGDGGTFGLKSGEGHKVADVTEEAEPIVCPSPCGSFPDSSYGSMTVGSGG